MSAVPYCLVLTGASGGIGTAFSTALAPLCAAMLLVGRDLTRLEALQRELRERHAGLTVGVVAGDLTHGATRQQVLSAARALPVPVNLLINNAGVNDFCEFESQHADIMERLLNVNLLAPIQMTQTLLPLLHATPRAQIINVGSIFGYLGFPGFGVYCASKFGLRGFSQALRRELADTSISVRYFAPRSTDTPLNAGAISAMNRHMKTTEDSPQAVAAMLVKFIAGNAWERRLGFPERLFVFINQLWPKIVDRAIGGQLPTIRKFMPKSAVYVKPITHRTEEA